jgi:2-oxoisovalerate dehydrogenase E2 component (dihydrolipoyl transacylase)
MIIFKLPDLGEGLPDAIVREWYVKPGDKVKSDQALVSMETAKALVDVPSPYSGEVEKLFGKPGDTIETGQPLIGFVGEGEETERSTHSTAKSQSDDVATATKTAPAKATPAVRALAKKLGVALADISPRGEYITATEVEEAAQKISGDSNLTPLAAVRRAMVLSMTESHQRVAPITLSDDADIAAWDNQQDITVRLIRAVIAGCEAVPMLNATFDDEKMAYRLNSEINLGIAVDTPHGLYVPVIKNVAAQKDNQLREKINQFKQQAQEKTIQQADLHGATITLSNFGAFAGRYGSPIILPPMVAIVGIGKARDEVIAVSGKPAVHRIIPLSVTVDHRIVTGGEAARFLKAMIDDLAR